MLTQVLGGIASMGRTALVTAMVTDSWEEAKGGCPAARAPCPRVSLLYTFHAASSSLKHSTHHMGRAATGTVAVERLSCCARPDALRAGLMRPARNAQAPR
jgi:hypothetical protein